LPGGTSLRYNFLIGRSNGCWIFEIARKGLKDGRKREPFDADTFVEALFA